MIHNMPDQAEDGTRRTREIGELGFVPARRRHVLVRSLLPIEKKSALKSSMVERRRRHLDHHAERRHLRLLSLATQFVAASANSARQRSSSSGTVTIGIMTLRLPRDGGPGQRAQLRTKDVEMLQRQPHARAHREMDSNRRFRSNPRSACRRRHQGCGS